MIGRLETWLVYASKFGGIPNLKKVCVFYISGWLMVAVFITCLLVHSLAQLLGKGNRRPRPL